MKVIDLQNKPSLIQSNANSRFALWRHLYSKVVLTTSAFTLLAIMFH